jgi:glycosyltransferase involved in cell wall biosynthesis
MPKIKVSTVTPVYSGESYLENLVSAIAEIKEKWEKKNYPFQLKESIFVIDGAIDRSELVLRKISKKYHWIQIITLSRNFGQHPATIAGLLHSSSDWIITLDEDLQHDPKHFLVLLKKATCKELDIVYAKPLDSVHKYGYRDLSSTFFKIVIAKITGNPYITKFNSFRLIRGSIGRAAASVCSHETYFDIALCWFTDRLGSVSLNITDQRFIEKGKSGYNLRKLIGHARRLILSSQTNILRLGAIIGSSAIILSIVYGSITILKKVFTPEKIPVQGWTSLVLILLFFGGLTSLLLGIILEYLSNVLLHTQGKPAFFSVDRSLDKIAKKYFREMERNDNII